jgi:hypothetical protein
MAKRRAFELRGAARFMTIDELVCKVSVSSVARQTITVAHG